MGSGDGCGNGEPQSIASGLGIAGAVGAVEPVKQMGKVLPFHHRTGIVHREVQVFPLTPQLQRNGAAGFGVFQGVVQQNGEKLPQGFFIALVGEHRLDPAGEGLFLGTGQGLEGAHHLLCQIRDGEFDYGNRRTVLLHPGEQDQVVGEFCQPPGLGLDVGEPFILPQIHRQDLRIGVNDGQRGFQLVGGGRDELPLLLPGPLHRAHRPLGEQNADP